MSITGKGRASLNYWEAQSTTIFSDVSVYLYFSMNNRIIRWEKMWAKCGGVKATVFDSGRSKVEYRVA